MGEPAAPPSNPGFFDTIRGSLLTSIPAVSSLVFVLVAVKVFRASGMEATTTVAIVSEADVVALLKGVVLTLLPGFLTAVAATAMWWWADYLETSGHGAAATGSASWEGTPAATSLFSTQAAFVWSMLAMAFFTISWPIFLALVIPSAWATSILWRQWRAATFDPSAVRRARRLLKWAGGVTAAAAIGFLTLAPSVWLPLRIITVAPGHTVTLDGQELPSEFAGYVLSSDEGETNLLLAEPRVVLQVAPNDIETPRPLCVTPEAPTRFFYLRPSQVLGVDEDNHSPYPLCPDLDSLSIFGT